MGNIQQAHACKFFGLFLLVLSEEFFLVPHKYCLYFFHGCMWTPFSTIVKDIAEMGGPIVEIQPATVCRERQPVLHDLSLIMSRACSTAILGPNGSGKSTLMKLFTREWYPVIGPGGFVRVFGQETWNVWDLRRQLGMVSADLNMTIGEWLRGWRWSFFDFSRALICMIIKQLAIFSEHNVMP